MDPVANIQRQRELADKLLGWLTDFEDDSPADYDAIGELAQLICDLDEWRLKGGFDPYAATSLHDLMSLVRAHPDFAFGTVFTRGDFPGDVVPEDFNANVIEDLLTERGNLYIDDHCGDEA